MAAMDHDIISPRWLRLRATGAQIGVDPLVVYTVRPARSEPSDGAATEAVELFDKPPDVGGASAVEGHALRPGAGPVNFFAVLFRKQGMDRAEFQRYWLHEHSQFGLRVPKAACYVQWHTDAVAACDGIAQVAFPSLDDLREGLRSPVIAVDARSDEERFIDHDRSYGLVCEVVPGAGSIGPQVVAGT
jgi:hypothetical protein